MQTCLSRSQLSPRECTDARFGGCEPARRRLAVYAIARRGQAQTQSQFFKMTQLPPAALSSPHILAAFSADAKEPTRAR
jgi:hypothetical protein